MKTFDLTPLYRNSIGFDHVSSLLNNAMRSDVGSSYPPYNIERLSENGYRITMAVAGFADDEISVEMKEGKLTVKASKAEGEKPESAEYLHRGIATRSFERRFQIADHVEVVGADLKDGLLHIELQRNLPDRMKPRTIAIGRREDKVVDTHKIEEAQV